MSLAGVPAIMSAPQVSATTWLTLFNRGKDMMPKFAAFFALCYGYAAYDAASSNRSNRSNRSAAGFTETQQRWKGYLVAAALTMSIAPFTLVVMRSANADMFRAVAEGEPLGWARMARWSRLNVVRSLLPLAATAVGFWTFLGNLSS
jgi:hypothetical protein